MEASAGLPLLIDALKWFVAVGGGAFIWGIVDRWYRRRDTAYDRRTEEQKLLDAQEQRLRENLMADLEHARRDIVALRADLKESNDACDKAYELVTRWRRAARRLDDWAHATVGDARNEIQRLASLLRQQAPNAEFTARPVPQPPYLESLMEPDPAPPAKD